MAPVTDRVDGALRRLRSPLSPLWWPSAWSRSSRCNGRRKEHIACCRFGR